MGQTEMFENCTPVISTPGVWVLQYVINCINTHTPGVDITRSMVISTPDVWVLKCI